MPSTKQKEVLTINNDLVYERCPCCKSNSIKALGQIKYPQKTRFSSSSVKLNHIPELWECMICSSWFTQNRIPKDLSIQLYSKGDSWAFPSFQGSKSRRTVSFIENLVKKDSSLLDVGCSNGSLLDYAKSKGCKTFGLEYSHTNRKKLSEKSHTSYGSWEQVKKRFDIITAFDLVEHLYDLDDFLDNCYNNLIDGGVLVLLTGNIHSWSAKMAKHNWWYLRFPEHIVFPSHDYLASLKGFELIETYDVYPFRFLSSSRSVPKHMLHFVRVIGRSVLRADFSPLPYLPRDHSIIVLKKSA